MSVYTQKQRRLHWAVALLIALQFALQGPMRRAMSALDAGGALGVDGFLVTTWHTFAGLVVGALMMARWHVRRRGPPGDGTLGPRVIKLARLQHRLLYMAVALMIVSGVLHYHVGWSLAGQVHAVGKWVLGGLVLIHVLAALWHHLVRRDAVLSNMIGSARHADTIDRQ